MTKVQNFSEMTKENQEKNKNNSLKINDLEIDLENEFDNEFVQNLKEMEQKIIEIASNDVLAAQPIFRRFDAKMNEEITIISQGTINILQGKMSSHKSRISELFCALLLAYYGRNEINSLAFVAACQCAVVYFDTERLVKDEFPLAVQRIREKAGYAKTENVPNFYPMSIARYDRDQRIEYVKQYLNMVRKRTEKPLFVVLDVVTDCLGSFNSERESMRLFDELRNFCEEYNSTFFLVIHENPSSEKARGHTGTEGGNKASTVMQISVNDDENDKATNLVKIKFIKTRNSQRPQNIYMAFSKQEKGLVLADDEMIKAETSAKKRGLDTDLALWRRRSFVRRRRRPASA